MNGLMRLTEDTNDTAISLPSRSLKEVDETDKDCVIELLILIETRTSEMTDSFNYLIRWGFLR